MRSFANQVPNLDLSGFKRQQQRPQPNPPQYRQTVLVPLEGLEDHSKSLSLVLFPNDDPLWPDMTWVVGGTSAAGSARPPHT